MQNRMAYSAVPDQSNPSPHNWLGLFFPGLALLFKNQANSLCQEISRS